MKDKKIDLGYNSKCLKCGKQLCGCEFRQTKTWQEKFDKKFNDPADLYSLEPVKEFIADLLQNELQQLIKKHYD